MPRVARQPLLALALEPVGEPRTQPVDARRLADGRWLLARTRLASSARCCVSHSIQMAAGTRFQRTIRLAMRSLPPGFATLADTGLCGVPPAVNDFGIEGARLIAPGEPDRSILYTRSVTTGPGKMHPFRNLPDAAFVELLREWILSLECP